MVLALLLSVAAASTALALPQGSNSQPVHVWLQAASRLVPGALVHTFVQISTPGDLIVLHRRTDGRIDVLFPTNPAQDPFTPAGTYELVSGARGAAFDRRIGAGRPLTFTEPMKRSWTGRVSL